MCRNQSPKAPIAWDPLEKSEGQSLRRVSIQEGPGTKPEPETGFFRTILPGTESGTGTARTVLSGTVEPKPEPYTFPLRGNEVTEPNRTEATL